MLTNLVRKTPRKEGRLAAERNPDNWQPILAERKESIRLSQAPRLNKLQAKYADLREQEQRDTHVLTARNDEQPPSEKEAFLYLVVATVLFLGCWAAAKFSLEPFWHGLNLYLGSLMIVGTTTGALHLTLDGLRKQKWIKFSLSGCLLFLLMVVHFYLGLARAEMFKELVTDSNGIYAKLQVYLKIAWPLIGLIGEFVTGFLFYEAYEIWSNPTLVARRRVARIREEMIETLEQYRRCEVIPEIFEKEFRAGALDARKKQPIDVTIAKLIPLILVALVILIWILSNVSHAESLVPDQKNLVILLDLSKSRNAKTHDEQTEFQKDVLTITETLSNIPPGTNVTAIGVTGNSFGSPFILIREYVTSEPGYFKEKLKKSRDKLLLDWAAKSKKLQPTFETTDLFGALAAVSQLRANPNDKFVLVILSDMQNDDNANFDFDRAKAIPAESIQNAEKQGLIASLRGMEVYCLGVTAGQKSLAYWKSLNEFWIQYFKKSGASLRKFSVYRDFNNSEQGGPR